MTLDQARKARLARGRHWYVVYVNGTDDMYIQARSHAEAELKAYGMWPANLGVAYTEL